jgi:hypothetical protein
MASSNDFGNPLFSFGDAALWSAEIFFMAFISIARCLPFIGGNAPRASSFRPVLS